MEANIKSARAHNAISWFYLLIGLLCCVFPYMTLTHEANPGVRAVALSLLAPTIFVCLFALHHAVARGARLRKEWARIASIIIGVVLLIGFPIWTVIGIYLLANSTWKTTPGVAAAT